MAQDNQENMITVSSSGFTYNPISVTAGNISCGKSLKSLLDDAVYHSPYWHLTAKYVMDVNIEKYIINENATIIFWDDGTKTISKRDENDKFDKELGFLFAYFYKKYKGTKASMKRVLDTIDYKKIKTFLFEFYVIDSEKTAEQAKKYLKNLVVVNK